MFEKLPQMSFSEFFNNLAQEAYSDFLLTEYSQLETIRHLVDSILAAVALICVGVYMHAYVWWGVVCT